MIAPPVAEKLGKLIPRLASGHDGERLATLAAIERTLASAGADLHDLAAAIQTQPELSRRRDTDSGEAVFWRDLSHTERHAWLLALYSAYDILSAWEEQFVASLLSRSNKWTGVYTTPRQREILDRILFKAVTQGVRP